MHNIRPLVVSGTGRDSPRNWQCKNSDCFNSLSTFLMISRFTSVLVYPWRVLPIPTILKEKSRTSEQDITYPLQLHPQAPSWTLQLNLCEKDRDINCQKIKTVYGAVHWPIIQISPHCIAQLTPRKGCNTVTVILKLAVKLKFNYISLEYELGQMSVKY